MIKDESKGIWHCVHIIQRINGHYLLKHARVSLPQELRDAMERQEIKDRWKHKLLKENCIPKQIRAQVAQLKQEKQLPQSKKDYRPFMEFLFETVKARIIYPVRTITLS
jgi:hypothetical protein